MTHDLEQLKREATMLNEIGDIRGMREVLQHLRRACKADFERSAREDYIAFVKKLQDMPVNWDSVPSFWKEGLESFKL